TVPAGCGEHVGRVRGDASPRGRAGTDDAPSPVEGQTRNRGAQRSRDAAVAVRGHFRRADLVLVGHRAAHCMAEVRRYGASQADRMTFLRGGVLFMRVTPAGGAP